MAEKKEWKSVSLNPNDMVQTGLFGGGEGFYGTIKNIAWVPYDFNGRSEQYGWSMAARITYLTDDEEEHLDHILLGSMTSKDGDLVMAPSLDDSVPHPDLPDDLDDLIGDDEAIANLASEYVVSVYGNLSKKSPYAQWSRAMVDAGFPTSKITTSLKCYLGVHGHWLRLPLEGSKTDKTIVVLTEFKEVKKAGKAGKAETSKASTKATKAAPEPEEEEVSSGVDDSFTDEVVEFVVELLADGPQPEAQVKVKAIQKWRSEPDKKKAAADLISSPDFQNGYEDLWVVKNKKYTAV